MTNLSLDPDFRDMLSAFTEAGVEFLLVGGYAMSAHGLPRFTRDIDLLVRASAENAARVWRALGIFGAPKLDYTLDDFSKPGTVVQFGLPPKRIDILTSIEAVDFDRAWPSRLQVVIDGLLIPVIGRADLIRNKRALGREQDMLDAKRLEAIDPHSPTT